MEKTSTECVPAPVKKKLTFKELTSKIKAEKIKFRTDKEWELFLPAETSTECVNKVIRICRDNLLVTWHIIYTDVTEENPKSEIRMYWDEPSTE